MSKVTDIIPVEDAEVSESNSAGDPESEQETVEPPDPPVFKILRTRGTHYSLRGLIKLPQRFS